MIAFRHPAALLLIVAVAALWGVFAWSRARRRRDLQRIGDWRLVSGLMPVESVARRRLKERVALAAAALLVLAAAGPLFGTRMKEVQQRGVDVFIAIDTSRSMLAEDVSPSRLARAKQSLSLLIGKLAGNRLGIVAFAKRAILQCPLTTDPDAARLFLESVSERTVPEQGTGIGSAIRLALSHFPKGAKTGRAIVLLTDGEDTGSDPLGAAREAKAQGVVVFTIGIGTTKGEVIKDRDEQGNVTSFHKYKGEMVVSRLDDAMLTKIAEITGGAYYRSSSSDREIDEIAEALNGFEKREFTSRVFDRMRDRYQWPAFLALLALLIEFFFAEAPGQRRRVRDGLLSGYAVARGRLARLRRRKGATAAALVLAALLAVPASADVRASIREGNRLFADGDVKGAVKAFESAQVEDPDSAEVAFNLGTARYAAGDVEGALREFERAAALAKDAKLQARIAYNAGHALFSAGRAAEALEKFKQTLRLDPSDQDAKYNVEYIRAGKKPPPPQPKPQEGPEKGGDKESPQQQPPKPEDGGDDESESAEPQPKPGEMSKESAEQILQMIQDEESENMKRRPARPIGDENNKPAAGGEDW